jgi:hypothetical protein
MDHSQRLSRSRGPFESSATDDLEDHLVGSVTLGEGEGALEVLGEVLGLLDGGDDGGVNGLGGGGTKVKRSALCLVKMA